MDCLCNLVKEFRGQEAADYLRDHLVPGRSKKKPLLFECPLLHNEWESNGMEGDRLVTTRVRLWFPVG